MTINPLESLREYVQRVGLKNTRQREIIAEEFFRHEAHMTAEEILESVRKVEPKISLATVYRTLKLLQECGLARAHHFGDGQARYERNAGAQEHHDHLICRNCGKITEFYNEEIERLQDAVALAHGFKLEDHRMELYGRCPDCQ